MNSRWPWFTSALAAWLVLAILACGGDKSNAPVNFQKGSGSISIPSANLESTRLELSPDDTAFFGRANFDETQNSLMVSLRSADNEIFLSVDVYNVRSTRPYALDSTTGGRINVLIGAACEGGNNGVAPGCKWYLSDFFQEQCWVALRTLTDEVIEGEITCGALGANCPAGTGIRTSTGACADGERYEPINLEASFRLEEPVSVLDIREPNPLYFVKLDPATNFFVQDLDDEMLRLLAGYNVPGASVALIRHGQLVWAAGYGFADVGKNRAVLPSTIFSVKSLSKPFTAWAVMSLVEQGRIDLDAPIDQYLSNWHLPASAYDHRLITPRRLLSHTAGISGIAGRSVGPTLEASLLGKAKGAIPATIQYPPGEFHYSDHGYSILQLAVEEITGQSFASFMEKEMLWQARAVPACYLVVKGCKANAAIGYETNEDHPDGKATEPIDTITEQAAFGLNASVPAIANFVAAVVSGLGERSAPQQILTRQSLGEMLSPVSTTNIVDTDRADSWGLGFALTHLASGSLLVSHGGGGCCNKALLSFLPESGDGVVILTNGTQGHMLMEHVQCEWLAWTQGASGESCGGLYDIFTMTADGNDLRRVLSDPHAELLPHWSPDGSSIAFSGSRNFNQDIYIANTVDWQQRRLTTNSSFDASPSWSPDGSRIAFTRVDNGVTKIYTMKPEGSDQKRLSKNPGEELLPSWSPDGTRIAFAGNIEPGSPFAIWIIGADGNGLRRVGTLEAGVGRPVWSPDGLSLAFSSGGNIYIAKVDGSTTTQLTFDGNVANSFYGSIDPTWSPDGRQIAFASGSETDHDIFAMDANGSNRKQLTSGASDDRAPSWSPDRSTIAFSSTQQP